jgi:hypothetical protein
LGNAAALFVAEGDVFGLELVEAHESAAAELARLRGVLQRFPEGSLHVEALEGKCVAHCFSGRAEGRLTIKTKVTYLNHKRNIENV